MNSFDFIFFIIFLFRPFSADNIWVCSFTSYDPLFIQMLKIPLNRNPDSLKTDCILKNTTPIFRRVFINNISNFGDESKVQLFDQIYNNLAEAFQNESRLLSQYLISNLDIVLENGDHLLQNTAFMSSEEEFFRRILTNISLTAEMEFANVIVKSNNFFVFISSSFLISKIIFWGNDKSCQVTYNLCCSNITDPLSNNSQCDDASQNFQNHQNFIFYGLFNLEFVVDNNLNIKPSLTLMNCKFLNFLIFNSTGFYSLVSLAPVSGNLLLYSVVIENSLFPQGLIYYSKYDFDPLYSTFSLKSKTQNSLNESIVIFNSSIYDYNANTKKNGVDLFMFSFISFDGDISVESCLFSSVVNITSIFYIANLGIQNFFQFKNSTIQNITQTMIAMFSGVNSTLIKKLSVMNYYNLGIPIFSLSNANIWADEINLSDFKLEGLSSCFEIAQSFFSIQDSFFVNGSFNSFIIQDSYNLVIENCSFVRLAFNANFIIFAWLNGVKIIKSSFFKVIGVTYLFYLENSDFFIITDSIINQIDCYAIFYFKLLHLNFNFQMVLSNSIFGYVWDQEITCSNLQTNLSTIFNNTVTGCFFRALSFPNLSFSFYELLILGNKFLQILNSAGMIQTRMGSCTLNKTSFIENFFLNHEVYRYLFEIGKACNFVTIDCFFKDNGIISKKFQYFGYNDNNMIALWSIFYSSFNNITMIITDKVELLGGFISASPHLGVFELSNSRFIFNVTNNYFEYKGIQLDSCLSATLINNTFYNLKCNSRSFATRYGGVCLFASSSYLFSKGQNNYWVYMKNNTFYNSSCINGGGLAVFGINNITIIDIFFNGSITDNQGGSFILVGSEHCILQNIVLNDSVGFRGGGFYIQNIFSLQAENISLNNVLAFENAVIFIKYINNCVIKNINTFNTKANVKGGVFFIFESFFALQMGHFLNPVASLEGGTLFCDDRSVVIMDYINVTNSYSEKGGVFSVE